MQKSKEGKNKIGIVTWYESSNYGTCLQAYGLYKYLEKQGFDVYFLKSIHAFYPIVYPVNYISLRLKSRFQHRIGTQNCSNIDRIAEKNHEFANKHFHLLSIKGQKQWKMVQRDFYAFVSGGDQIWNPHYLWRANLLDFLYRNKKVKRYSYATSIGVDEIPLKYKNIYKTLWRNYDDISVRENSAAEIVYNVAGREAKVVLDSVFLLDELDWDELAAESNNDYMLPKKYICTYFVGNNDYYNGIVKEISEELGTEVINISFDYKTLTGNDIDDAGVTDFLRILKSASYVVTDSFHAIAFSIIFNKQFYVLKRFKDDDKKSQNSRIYNVLKMFCLENRIIDQHVKKLDKIDYELINKIKRQRFEESISFLKKNHMAY